ncbi:MAG: PrkA family serine protein kinase, partial [Gammaproteobacteria bacterium]|nr:PrkA family serine protein kinase [Gammaproteobacteria bacterium]
MGIFSHYKERYDESKDETLSIKEYLDLCKKDPSVYASASERMLKAIGEPEYFDTRKDPRYSRLFSNRIIK